MRSGEKFRHEGRRHGQVTADAETDNNAKDAQRYQRGGGRRSYAADENASQGLDEGSPTSALVGVDGPERSADQHSCENREREELVRYHHRRGFTGGSQRTKGGLGTASP